MALKERIKGLIAKAETTYATDPTVALTDTIETVGLEIQPYVGENLDLEQDRASLGASGQVPVGEEVTMNFGVYAVGAGAAATKPGFAALLESCGLKGGADEKVAIWTNSGNETSGGYKTNDGQLYKAKNNHTRADANEPGTNGGNSVWEKGDMTKNQASKQFDGFAYKQKMFIYTEANNTLRYFRCIKDHTDGSTTRPPIGNTDGGRSWKENWQQVKAGYSFHPISAEIPSLWMEATLDGQKHISKGSRGNLALEFQSRTLPRMNYSFRGLYATPTTVVTPEFDYSKFLTPQGVTNRNTPNANLHGIDVIMNQLSLDFGNQLEHIDDVNLESIDLNQREVSGSIVIEMPKISTRNWFTTIRSLSEGPLLLEHGDTAGKGFQIYGPSTTLGSPTVTNVQGRFMLEIPLRFVPVSQNDDVILTTF